jgi:hypothetical protein
MNHYPVGCHQETLFGLGGSHSALSELPPATLSFRSLAMTVAGHDFWFMWGLAPRAYVTECKDSWVLQTFSPGLMIAISWEQSEFNSIRQSGFTHIDWMKRWTDIDPITNAPR